MNGKRDDAGWRRGPAEETSSWRDSSRREEWDRGGRDMRDRRADDREPPLRRGPPLRSDREERMFVLVFLKACNYTCPLCYPGSIRR